jgi:hypothetical protein
MNEREFFEGRTKAAEIAKEKGFRGFAVIPHPFRLTEAAKAMYDMADVEYGIWVWWRRDRGFDDDLIYWSPHYHIIGATSADMDEADSEGWVYQFKDSLPRFDGIRDRDSHESVYRVFRYLLSHTGFPEGSTKQATVWYGDLGNNVFVEEATESWQAQKPPEHIRDSLRSEIEEAVGPTAEDDERADSGVDVDDKGECPNEDCDGVLIDVFDVSAYLRQCQPPEGVREIMIAARDWRLGRVVPPPGLRFPQTEEQARESFEAVL